MSIRLRKQILEIRDASDDESVNSSYNPFQDIVSKAKQKYKDKQKHKYQTVSANNLLELDI
jgi:hypothetical protein